MAVDSAIWRISLRMAVAVWHLCRRLDLYDPTSSISSFDNKMLLRRIMDQNPTIRLELDIQSRSRRRRFVLIEVGVAAVIYIRGTNRRVDVRHDILPVWK
jgi:hypothetical protein